MDAHRAATNLTHLSLNPSGKYHIEENELPILYTLMKEDKGPNHILESHNDQTAGPLLIDLDFNYPEEPRFHTRQYTAEEVCKFVE